MKTQKVQIASVIVDETLYPRHKISEGNVAQLKEALLAGATFPPIVLDAKSMKVVDGWHRIEAAKRLYGEGAILDAELRNYETPREMFRDAVKLNAAQGLKLTTWDKVRSIVRMLELQTPEADIRTALSITEEKMGKLLERVATGARGEKIPLKGSMRAFGGKVIDEEQQKYNEGPGPGLGIGTMLAQIIRALEAKVVDVEDAKIVAQFERIIELYQEAVA